MSEADLNEAGLCLQIMDDFYKTFSSRLRNHPFNSPGPVKPTGSKLKPIPKDQYETILSFFGNKVLPFALSLEDFSSQLTRTLDFDLHKIFKAVSLCSEKISIDGDLIIEKLPKRTAKIVKECFRYVIWPWIRESYFVSRGLLKPNGYPGDYKIVESMYEGNAKSLGLGYIYDIIFLESQLCQGLRNRKDQMKQIISNYLNISNKNSHILFNVGCGGSRELRELNFDHKGEGLALYLLDFDREAIDFSIKNLQANMPKSNITSINIDVKELTTKDGLSKLKLKQPDLIYSIGLFDYLPDKIIISLLANLLNLLRESGMIIFAHKDYTLYNPRIADWFCDWRYYSRTQKDFDKIFVALGIEPKSVSFSREKDGYIFFAKIIK